MGLLQEKNQNLLITFVNKFIMNRVKNMWFKNENDERSRCNLKFKTNGKVIELELYESNIPPLLRFLHIYEISPSGWVSIPANKASTDKTNCDFEYVCKLSDITPLSDKETTVPYKIMSFDIEADSSHGDFPVPIKNYKKLATNIADIFIKKQITSKDGASIFKKIIIKAFFPDERILSLKMETIDQVYPKNDPIKENINKIVDKLLSKNIKGLIKSDTDISKINSYFERNDDSDDEEEYNNKNVKVDINKNIIDLLCSNKYNRDIKYNTLQIF